MPAIELLSELEQDAILWKSDKIWSNAGDPDERVIALEKLVELMLVIPNEMKRNEYVTQLQKRLKVPDRQLYKETKKAADKKDFKIKEDAQRAKFNRDSATKEQYGIEEDAEGDIFDILKCVNDTNKELINFYRVLQNRYVELEKMIHVTLHSRSLHKDASVIYNNPHLFDEVQRAWAVWVHSTQSFSAQLDNSWGFDITSNTTTKKIRNNKERFTQDYAIRLQNVELECTDALYIIQSRDTLESFFYCDPPYIGSDCGHYDGYLDGDFEKLLQLLSRLKGKFLLSSYPSDMLKQYARANGWHTECFEQGVSVMAKGGYRKRKVEVLTWNYFKKNFLIEKAPASKGHLSFFLMIERNHN